MPLWTCRSNERVLLLPTKLEAAAKDNTGRSCTQGEEETEEADADAEEAEAEAEEERCWVCLEGEEKGPLVQLCACRGSNKWSHRACVEHWRRDSDKEDAAYRCGQCMDHYRDSLSLELHFHH